MKVIHQRISQAESGATMVDGPGRPVTADLQRAKARMRFSA